MIKTGIDLVEIDRFQEIIDAYGDRFLSRIFTKKEIEEVRHSTASLAVRFAAKEAVSKVFGTGIGVITWKEIEILRGFSHEPILNLYGKAAKIALELGLSEWSISLSHSNKIGIASVVAYCN